VTGPFDQVGMDTELSEDPVGEHGHGWVHTVHPKNMMMPAATTARQNVTRAACLFFNVLCGLTNGYYICVISVVLDSIVADFGLCTDTEPRVDIGQWGMTTCSSKEAIMSITSLGSLCAKLCLPWMADRFGRRGALAFVDCLIIAAATMQCIASGQTVFFLGRFVLGMGIGLAFVVEPTYIAEIAPPARRGQYVVLNEVAVCVGCLLGLQVAAFLFASHGPQAWRLAMAVGALPAILQLVCIFGIPESPRWLALQGDSVGLERAIVALGLSREEADCLHERALQPMMEANGSTRIFWSFGAVKRLCASQAKAWNQHGHAFLLALLVLFFSKASSNFAMQAYALDILKFCGVEHPRTLLPIIGWMKLAGALIAMAGTDASWIGRRRLALIGGLFCTLCDLVLVARLSAPDFFPPGSATVAFFVFILSWNVGYGGIQFTSVMEVLPNEVRAVWSGQIFAIAGVVEILIYQLFEVLLIRDGLITFASFGIVNALGVVFAACLMPDLRGQSLEQGCEDLLSTAPESFRRFHGQGPSHAVRAAVVSGSINRKRRYGKLDESAEAVTDSHYDHATACVTSGASAHLTDCVQNASHSMLPEPSVIGVAVNDGI